MSADLEATRYLTRQHRALEAAFREALDAQDAAVRRSRFLDIADALAVHVASEEQVFYPATSQARTRDILLESLEEHLSMKRLLADLLELEAGDPAFQPKLHVLMEQAEHHHKEEEDKLFPQVRALLDEARLTTLGAQIRALQLDLQQQGRPRSAMLAQTEAAQPLD